MKSVAVIALAAGASAQVSLYAAIASAINGQIGSLDSAIKAYTGGNGADVISSASALLSAVESGSAAAAKGQSITDLNDALSLLTPYVAVVSSVKGVVGDLVSKKTLAFQNGLGSTAEALLKEESSAAGALASVIIGQLKGDAAAGAAIASGSILIPLNSALNSGISAFASGPAATGGSGSSSSSSASKSSSSSSASASSASSGSSASSSKATGAATTTSASATSAVSSVPSQFPGAASGLEISGGVAAIVGALAYLL